MSRHELIESIKSGLDEMDKELAALEASAREFSEKVSEKVSAGVKDAKDRREAFRLQFAEFQAAAGEAAGDVRGAIEIAWDALKMGVLAVRSDFEEVAEDKKEESSKSKDV